MKASLVDLRRRPARILKAVENRETVILSRRGRPIAKIAPLVSESLDQVHAHEAFGMWEDRDAVSVEEQVRDLRKGRFHDL